MDVGDDNKDSRTMIWERGHDGKSQDRKADGSILATGDMADIIRGIGGSNIHYSRRQLVFSWISE